MKTTLIFFFAIASMILVSCGGSSSNSGPIANDSPTEAYKRLFNAVKSKNINAIKAELSKKTADLGKMSMETYKKTEKEAFENGFTPTTMSPTMPNLRDERVKGNSGAVEVWNSRDSRWEDVPFILEDGRWKLAVGDAFANTWELPAKSRDTIDREAANALSANQTVVTQSSNANSIPIVNSNMNAARPASKKAP